MNFPVGVSNSCDYGDVLFIMDKIFFPDFNCLAELVQRLVAVSESEKGIVVVRVEFQAFVVEIYCSVEIFLFPLCVTKSNKRIIIVCVKFKDFLKEFLCCFKVVCL